MSTACNEDKRRPDSKSAICRRHFSLIELLVVTGVIAILAGMLMPALTKARAKAMEANIINSVRQMHLALLMYYDSDEDNKFLPNTGSGTPGFAENVGVDFTELVAHGYVPKMMEDPFRGVPIADDPDLQLTGFTFDSTSFHSSGRGLLYFNFEQIDLVTFNNAFGYNLPDDTQWAIVGVGMNEKLDLDRPQDDLVIIKRVDNSNNERWPTF